MKFRFHIENCIGPWASLGIHVDVKHPYVDLHLLWWIVSFGNLYWWEMATEHRLAPQEYRVFKETRAELNCPECGCEIDAVFELPEMTVPE